MSSLTDLLREFEGLRLTAYKCPAGVWTIGYGHTGADVRPGMTITQDQAEELLYRDLAWVRAEIEASVNVPLDSAQTDAISSLIFNIGASQWRKSTVLKRLNAGNMLGAADAISMWNKARVNGELKVLPGLVRRREAERTLFLSGMTQDNDEPQPQAVEGGALKPQTQSKEQAIGVIGAIGSVGAIWSQVKSNVPETVHWVGPYLPYILLAGFLGIMLNRYMARARGDR